MGVINAEHLMIIREEIVSTIAESLGLAVEDAQLRSPEMLEYIETQVRAVVTGMYNVPMDDPDHPANNDPFTVPRDYYRESIDEFSTVYKDYDL